MPTSFRVLDGAGVCSLGMAEYLWIEGNKLRSKIRAIPVGSNEEGPVPILEVWNTHINDQPVLLSPCHYLPDPLRSQPSYLVLCEVRDLRDLSVPTNTRNPLRFLLKQEQFLGVHWGFRQRYHLDGPEAEIAAERHFGACLDSGLMIHSASWDRPFCADWEFKIGPRQMPLEIDQDDPMALVISDHLWIARHLMTRIAKETGTDIRFGKLSVFFSTEDMRKNGLQVLNIPDGLKLCVSASERRFGCYEKPCEGSDPYEVVAQVLTALWKSSDRST